VQHIAPQREAAGAQGIAFAQAGEHAVGGGVEAGEPREYEDGDGVAGEHGGQPS